MLTLIPSTSRLSEIKGSLLLFKTLFIFTFLAGVTEITLPSTLLLISPSPDKENGLLNTIKSPVTNLTGLGAPSKILLGPTCGYNSGCRSLWIALLYCSTLAFVYATILTLFIFPVRTASLYKSPTWFTIPSTLSFTATSLPSAEDLTSIKYGLILVFPSVKS